MTPLQKSPSIETLIALTHDDMVLVNETILKRADSHVELVPEIANHLIQSGGKRLRPMLTLAATRLFGTDNGDHIKMAAAIEFMHNATLLHDDVVDESDMRRGKPAARKIWGNQASVLVGDFLLGQAFLMMVETGSLEALQVLSATAAVIAEGEVLQLASARTAQTDETIYFKIIDAKTAALFAAATEIGAIIGHATKDQQGAVRTYGTELGIAFQLIDDVLDFGGTAQNLGKNTGDDLREGKMTLPIILAYNKSTAEEQAFWRTVLDMESGDTQPHEVTADNLGQALALLVKYDSLNETANRARHHGALAKKALRDLPAGPYHDSLIEIVDFCIERIS